MVSFKEIFHLARILDKIQFSILEINVESNGFFLLGLKYEDKKINKLKDYFTKLNKHISYFNEIKNKRFIFLKSKDLSEVNFNEFEKILKLPSKSSKENKELILLKRENLFSGLKLSIENFFESFDNMLETFGGPKKQWCLHSETYSKFSELMEIYSLGFLEASVLLSGKMLEEVLNNYIKILVEKNLISFNQEETEPWSFDKKINILYGQKKISETQRVKALSVKWDRNTCAHPSKKEEIEQVKNDADAIIKISINLLHEIEKKIFVLEGEEIPPLN